MLQHKRGDDLILDAQLLMGPGGQPVDIAGWAIRSQLRRARPVTLLGELEVVIEDPAEGRFCLRLPRAAQADWPVGRAFLDIAYLDIYDVLQSTESIQVELLDRQTWPEAE